jgi:murein DD-endopeptidase MepM/ murein hydrolase activator NlpD
VTPGHRPDSVAVAGALIVWLVVLAATAAVGCHSSARPMHPEPPPGHWYVVEPNETLGDIARRAGVLEEDLLEVNGFHDATEIHPGQVIFVLNDPNAKSAPPPASPEPNEAPPSSAGSAGPAGSAHPTAASAARFRWPVDAPRVTSLFGKRWGKPHEGIDLVAPVGTPVYAADVGEVVYAGNTVRGYGNMVVVRHADDLMTVYAHNSVLLVKVGDRVTAGQRVALSGQSGHATGPHVHFEVRRGQTPRDPLLFLPGRKANP